MNKLINLKTKPIEKSKGFVWIVGAGPGDAELLTIKAYKALQVADVVLYDCLVDSSVLQLIPATAIQEYVGKRSKQHSMHQNDICKRMVFHANQGKNVVRLKGGDPAIFARTVEETEMLSKHQIEFVIVPGITSASGASAYSGIPLTQRDCAQTLTFTTASLHCQTQEPNWQNLVSASSKQTLVFYMGLGKVGLIAQRLIEHGLDKQYPIAVIDRACTRQQCIIKGSLEDIAQNVNQADISGPAIIVCGEVVKHQQQVSKWALYLSPEVLVQQSLEKPMNDIQLAI
jgi:uroporphyrin-III C-methyltransferase